LDPAEYCAYSLGFGLDFLQTQNSLRSENFYDLTDLGPLCGHRGRSKMCNSREAQARHPVNNHICGVTDPIVEMPSQLAKRMVICDSCLEPIELMKTRLSSDYNDRCLVIGWIELLILSTREFQPCQT
jgi:hypothetical protein